MTHRTLPDGRAPEGAFGPSLTLRLLLLAGSCLLAVAAAEVAVRIALPQPLVEGDNFLSASRDLGWTNAPGHRGRLGNLLEFDTGIRINSYGLRGDEPTSQRPRLLGLGDASMFGYGVEENETLLARAAAIAGAVPLNGGVPRYDLCQAVDFGERLLQSLEIDALAVGVGVGDDEWEAGTGRGRIEVRRGRFVQPGAAVDAPSLWSRIRDPLFTHSHLVRMLGASSVAEALTEGPAGVPSIDEHARQASLWAYDATPPQAIADGDRVTVACLQKLRRMAAARGIPVVAELLPDAIEVVPGQLEKAAAAAGLDDVIWDVDGPRRRFTAMFNQAGIAVIDPIAELRAAATKGTRLYFERDRHFTAAGARIAGEKLGAMLRQIRTAPPVATGPLTPHGFS